MGNKKWIVGLGIFIMALGLSGQSRFTKTLSPYFFVSGGESGTDLMPLKETRVTVNISGVIAEVTVCQVYRNQGQHVLSAQYVFPASTRAAVHGMRMTIGDKIIRAQVMKREAAKKTFETAKREGKSASLLEEQRPNVFTMNVANILPGDIVSVELKYTEILVPTGGIYEFVYPTVVGPRYSNQPEESASQFDLWVKNPYFRRGQEPVDGDLEGETNRFSINCSIATGIPLQELTCSSHKTNISWEGAALAHVNLDSAEKMAGNRDYILRYRLVGSEILSGLILDTGEEENFFLLMVQPPQRISPAQIPPREYLFVVDVSGSMHGFPLETSKELIRKLLPQLRLVDTFNVILFSGCSSVMATKSIPATPQNIRKAMATIDRQQGGGGTELTMALEQAMSLEKEQGVSRSIILITDGFVEFEKKVFSVIRRHLNETNLFAFGIGSSVNRFLIEGAARAGCGELFVVTDPSQASGTAEKFREYIQSPLLTGNSLSFQDFSAYDIEPLTIPDLLASRPLVIFGEWRGPAHGTITLSGTGGTGPYRQTFEVKEELPSQHSHPLRYLWARTRITQLSDDASEGDEARAEEEVTSLGLAHNLLTRFTSFVAVLEEVRNASGDSQDVSQPLPLPQGISNLAVGGGTTGAPEPEILFVALLAIIFSASGFLRRLASRSLH